MHATGSEETFVIKSIRSIQFQPELPTFRILCFRSAYVGEARFPSERRILGCASD